MTQVVDEYSTTRGIGNQSTVEYVLASESWARDRANELIGGTG